jgi:hypothetical protein
MAEHEFSDDPATLLNRKLEEIKGALMTGKPMFGNCANYKKFEHSNFCLLDGLCRPIYSI